jgi:hypothetical protein
LNDRPDKAGGNARVHRSICACALIVMLLVAGKALLDEVFVARMRLLAQASPGYAAIALAVPNNVAPTSIPARGALYLALASGRAASVNDFGYHRSALVKAAAANVAAAKDRRPYWGEADVAQTYIDMIASGPTSPTTVSSLGRSYASGPYLDDAAPWRLALAVESWPRLDATTRGRAVDEALWFSGRSGAKYNIVQSILGASAMNDEVRARRNSYLARPSS